MNLPEVWTHVLDHYELISKIGSGTFGTVASARCIRTGELVAIKHVTGFAKYEYDCCKLIREIQIMQCLNDVSPSGFCSFIPQLLDVIIPEGCDSSNFNDIFMVLEYEEIDMRVFMKTGANLQFGQKHIQTMLYNMLCAVNFISSANVVHRDIKPANILINKHCQVKICDFGLARTLPESMNGKGSGNTRRVRTSILKHKVSGDESIKDQIRLKLDSDAQRKDQRKRSISSHVSSRWFRAPEVILLEKQYDQAIDMWSIGCVLFELIRFSNSST